MAVFGTGCSSAESSSTSNSNVVSSANTNATNNAITIPVKPANEAATETNAANTVNANQAQIKVVSPPANAKMMTFPAPNDSDYATTMNSAGQAIETRTFHNDPQINKVERVWKDVNDKTVNIYLKSGKMVKVPGDKWPDIKSLPVETFYEAAGIKPAQPAAKDKTTERKQDKPKQ